MTSLPAFLLIRLQWHISFNTDRLVSFMNDGKTLKQLRLFPINFSITASLPSEPCRSLLNQNTGQQDNLCFKNFSQNMTTTSFSGPQKKSKFNLTLFFFFNRLLDESVLLELLLGAPAIKVRH